MSFASVGTVISWDRKVVICTTILYAICLSIICILVNDNRLPSKSNDFIPPQPKPTKGEAGNGSFEPQAGNHGGNSSNYVEAHNKFRNQERVENNVSNMFKMVNDAALENKAREWANRCTFEHSIGTAGYTGAYDQYGECLAMTSNDKGFTWDRTVQLFYDEKEYFEYGKSEYSNVVTHYTQIVWAASYKVGCAEASCPNSKGNQGVYVGKPYKKGVLNGDCPKTPKDQLCDSNYYCNYRNKYTCTEDFKCPLDGCEAKCNCEGKIYFISDY